MKSVIPLLLFLLGCAGIYVGTVQAAFTALMRLSLALLGLVRRRDAEGAQTDELTLRGASAVPEAVETAAEEASDDEARLLRSIVHFGDTLVREIMTPRPDLVAIPAEATLG